VLRTDGDPGSRQADVRQMISAFDRTLRVSDVRTMDERLAEATSDRRFVTRLLAAFAALALALASIGTYASVTAIVGEGTREIAVRMALGATPARVMLRHIMPNCIGPLVVQVSISMGIAILIEASLSFIGLGTQPPNPSLGSMLSEGKDFMREAPWVVLFPGLAIMLAVLSFNLLGDGLHQLISGQRR